MSYVAPVSFLLTILLHRTQAADCAPRGHVVRKNSTQSASDCDVLTRAAIPNGIQKTLYLFTSILQGYEFPSPAPGTGQA